MNNLEYWSGRASKFPIGYQATSNDLNLKSLEENAIINTIKEYGGDNGAILDVGCGNGVSTKRYSEHFKNIKGIDFCPEMIVNAQQQFPELEFSVGDITQPLGDDKFDIMILNRCLQNINNNEQMKALNHLKDRLNKDGIILLCEYFHEYFVSFNALRREFDLDEIDVQDYNYLPYVQDIDMNFNIIDEIDFAGSYYLLSKIYNAYEAKQEGRVCKYDDELNLRALKFPSLPGIAPLRLIVI